MMTATPDLLALHAAVLADPTDRLAWLAYTDCLEEAGDSGDRLELVRLLARRGRLSRDEQRRLKHLRATVPLLSEVGRARVAAVLDGLPAVRPLGIGGTATLVAILRDECHPLLMEWGAGRRSGRNAARLILCRRGPAGGSGWVWSGNDGQGGGGRYPDRAEAFLAALATMTPLARERLGWVSQVEEPL